MGEKITLQEAHDGGARGVLLYCLACGHRGARRLAEIGDTYPTETRIDDLPYRCEACGSRQVEVRPDYGQTVAGGSLKLVE